MLQVCQALRLLPLASLLHGHQQYLVTQSVLRGTSESSFQPKLRFYDSVSCDKLHNDSKFATRIHSLQCTLFDMKTFSRRWEKELCEGLEPCGLTFHTNSLVVLGNHCQQAPTKFVFYHIAKNIQ